MKLPPGPRIPWLPLAQYALSPYEYVKKSAARYGDPFTVKTPYGPLVVTGEPSHVREVLRLSDEHTDGFGSESVRVFLGDGSVMLMGGARHKEERKLLAPLFSVARTGSYAERIYAIAQEEMHRHHGRPFSMQALTQEISLSVIIEVVFGIKDRARIALFRRAIHEQIAAVNPTLFFLPQLRVAPFGLGPWGRYQRAFHALNRLIEEETALRRREREPSLDLLSGLVLAQQEGRASMQPKNAIRDELVTMLIAGHETTGLALAWAFYWIHKYPEIRERLCAELRGATPTLEALNALPYLEAVCQEALRLNPVVPEFLRQLLAPQELFGYRLPAGTGLAVSVSLLHNNRELYPEPERFLPERFLERRFAAHEYAPFGGGAYRCVGAALAMQEMKLVLASVLQNHSLELLAESTPRPERRNWVIGPSTPMMMRSIQRAR